MSGQFDEKYNSIMGQLDEKKWAQDVNVDKGKMHRLLNVPEDEEVSEHYSDPQQLARDLYNATGNKKEASGMLSFAGNVNSGTDIFDKALQELEKMD